MLAHEFALHITWTTYGTWLPGDKRGFVSNIVARDGRFMPVSDVPGTPYACNDSRTLAYARGCQKHATTRLTSFEAATTAAALVDCATKQRWLILRAAIMANHVHVVIANCSEDGPAVRRALKGPSQAQLSKAYGIRRWWTEGGSDRYKHGEDAILNAVLYVERQEHVLAAVIENRAVQCFGDGRPA